MKMDRILIVDDKAENLYLLSALLKGHGYEIVTAAHGAEALILARQNPPDLVISDLLMPVMDGYTLLRHWKADQRLKAVPFVVYTATYTDEKDERLALDLGADDFILKPTEPEPFIARINETMAKARQGGMTPVRGLDVEKATLVKEYSEVLIRKLEEKALQLEEANKALQQDIVDRKRVEEALIKSEDNLRSVVQTAGDGIVTLDKQGNVHLWNGAAETLFGYSSAEMIGQPMVKVLPERSRGDFLKRAIRPMMTGQLILGQHPTEAFGLRRDGGEFPVEISISSWKLKEGTFSTAIIRDISERKRADEAMRKRLKELEGMNRVSTILRTAQTLEEMLPHLLEVTLATLESDTGAIWLFDSTEGTLRRVVARGWLAAMENMDSTLGEGLPGGIFEAHQVHLSDEFASDPGLPITPRGSIPAGWGGPCIQIRSEKEIIGMVCIALPLPRKISPAEINLLVTLSEMAGTAIQRVRLYDQTIQQVQRLSSLHTIDTAISSSFDLGLTLNIILDQANAQLQADSAAVLLLDRPTLSLRYVAGRGFRDRAIEQTRVRLGEGLAGRAAIEQHTVSLPDLTADPSLSRTPLFLREGFVSHFVTPLISKGQVKGVLEVFQRTPFNPAPDWMNFFETLAAQAAITVDNIQLFDGLQRSNAELSLAYDATIEGWSRALDMRDRETEGHTQRVTELTVRLARAMGLRDEAIIQIQRGALLHDIGKMAVPDAILLKPDKLSSEEWVLMRKHPQFAYDLLFPIEYLRPALDIPYCHHENFDGTGYPRGLKGENIPLAARLFAVVDVWDALCSDRPYRKAWSRETTLDHIRSSAGTHFDPQAVDLFLRVMTQGV